MFRHVREIIGDDVAAFLARARETERPTSAATPGVTHEAPAQHTPQAPPSAAPPPNPRAGESAVCCEKSLRPGTTLRLQTSLMS